jgi:plasmid stabilization system protein ParE
MKRDIIWLPEAEETFNKNIEYLSEKWTVQVINDFLDRVDEAIGHIAENPYLYAAHENREDIRKCPVTKQITLYFKILENKIDLLTFWNNYQDPDKLNL